MKRTAFSILLVCLTLVCVCLNSNTATAGNFWPFKFGSKSQSYDVRQYECDECSQIHDCNTKCIVRYPVEECKEGKMLVYDCKVKYEWVSIPEIRYRWKKRWVTKEIPCDYCKPVCKTEDGEKCYGVEKWTTKKDECGNEVHCKTIEAKTEKTPCKYCCSEPGKTTIKVRYKTCVKEAYTVYRRVKRPVCVKIPRYEKVEVPITKHVCETIKCDQCRGNGCASCVSK